MGTEVIFDVSTGDTLNLGNANLTVDGSPIDTMGNNEFMIIQGTYNAGTSTFTVGAGLNTRRGLYPSLRLELDGYDDPSRHRSGWCGNG